MSRVTGGNEPSRPGIVELAERFNRTLDALQDRSVRALREEVWRQRLRPFWRITPEAYRKLCRVLQARGENFLAIEVANEGLTWSPQDVELTHLFSLAYARAGASDVAETHARRLLELLADDGSLDAPQTIHWRVEALTLRARIEKDRWAVSTSDRERTAFLRACLRYYEEAYHWGALGEVEDDKYYPAINAAAAAAWLRETEQVGHYAALARDSCRRATDQGGAGYWPAATLAESALLLGETDESVAAAYCQATALAPTHWAKQNATRRQARTLLHAQGRNPALFDNCFALPRVILFTGHLTDQPGRPVPRFPEQAAQGVATQISAWLEQCSRGGSVPLIGFASAARGADLLFLEAMQAKGGEFHVVLPCGAERFRTCSVETDGATVSRWGERFDRMLEAAASVWTLPDERGKPLEGMFAYANQLLHGTALQKVREFELDNGALLTLAVWDGQPGDGPGGTAACVESWQDHGLTPVIIRPDSGEKTDGNRPRPARTVPMPGDARAGALLVSEWLSPLGDGVDRQEFFAHAAARLREDSFAKSLAAPPTVEEARVCTVFRSLDAAGRFAWALQAWAESREAKLHLRQGVHAAPVALQANPLTGQVEPVGLHRTTTVELCRSSSPGQVCASGEFAALLALENSRLRCEYLGVLSHRTEAEEQAIYTLRLSHDDSQTTPDDDTGRPGNDFC